MDSRLTRIAEQWFLSEGALFGAVCTHAFEENTSMKCPVRCGQRKIQYNPLYISQMSDKALEEALRNEAVRILLKHPYERRPEGCDRRCSAIGSNLVIGDNYSNGTRLNLETPADYELDSGQSYEWYAREIQKRQRPQDGSNADGTGQDGNKQTSAGDALSDLSELWRDDPLAVAEINRMIEQCQNWGSLPGNIVEQIKASTRAKVNWRNILAGFRASITSCTSRLTRMKPNRRTGYDNMGTARDYHARLLVATDTSGSVSDESLSHFIGIINRAFNAGVYAVDLLQFDHGIHSVTPLNRKQKTFKVEGRGGTDFQAPVDYAFAHGYDGLVILTDGYAPKPVLPAGRTRLMWVCTSKETYEAHAEWMRTVGRACYIELN